MSLMSEGCSTSTSAAMLPRALASWCVRLGDDPRQRAAMQQIADWLEKLGMSEYAQRFADNRIDFSVLPDLTDQHLEKLGVALGDRLKILRAIRELSVTTVAQPATSAAPVVQVSAERRQLTVMFCDLVGSTALSARLDPEDLRSPAAKGPLLRHSPNVSNTGAWSQHVAAGLGYELVV